MEISSQLMRFLSSSDAPLPLKLGHWLESLDDKDLAVLKTTAGSFDASDDADTHDELIKVISLLVAAEEQRSMPVLGAREVSDRVDALKLTTKIEMFRRRKWLLVDQPLSIQPRARVSISFTAEGMKHAAELRRH